MSKSTEKVNTNTTFKNNRKNVEGFVKKLEAQIDVFDFFYSVIGYADFNGENPHMSCPFCHGDGDSLIFDPVKKAFSCSICGLSGGLVLFVMLYYKIPLKIALLFFRDADFSVIPNNLRMLEE